MAHLDRVGDRPLGLFLQRLGPAVPELVEAVGAVDDRRAPAAAELPANALRETLAVGEGVLRVVATGAGDGAVDREALVEVEQPAELGLLRASTGCPSARRSAPGRAGPSARRWGTAASRRRPTSGCRRWTARRARRASITARRRAERVMAASGRQVDRSPVGWRALPAGCASSLDNASCGPASVRQRSCTDYDRGPTHFFTYPVTKIAFWPSTSDQVPVTSMT